MATKEFKYWNIDDIIAYCKEHDAVEWLKETASKKVPCEVYPRKRVQKAINGVLQYNKKGKPIMVAVADKDAKPVKEMRKITFVQIKTEFGEKFGFITADDDADDMYTRIGKL